jgi:hypothetical protein
MTNRLVESELPPFDNQRSVLVAHGTESAAIGAGLFAGEGLGLLVQESAEGALSQTGRGGGRDLLHGLEVEGTVGVRLRADATGNDFSPLGGEVADLLQRLRRQLALRHG